MKKNLLLIIILQCSCLSCIAQFRQTNTLHSQSIANSTSLFNKFKKPNNYYYMVADNNTKEYYIKRSKRFNKTGTILLCVGLASVIIPLAIPESDKYKGSYGFDATRVYFVFGGILSSLISIPYFISASSNKKKAMELTLLPNFTNSNSGLCINIKIKL